MTGLVDRLSKYLSTYVSSRMIFVADMLISIMSSVIALMIGIFVSSSGAYVGRFAQLWVLSSVVFSAVMFLWLKTFKIIIRHSTLKDIFYFFLASFGKCFMMLILLGMAALFKAVPFSANVLLLLLFDFLLTLFILLAVRICMIVAYDVYKKKIKEHEMSQRILVWGTSDKSVATITRLQYSPHYKVVGFLSDDFNDKNFSLAELPVYYYKTDESFASLVERLAVRCILFPSEASAQNVQNTVIAAAGKLGLKILITPSIDEAVNGVVSHKHIREIRIEDLLGRDEIKINLEEIEKDVCGKIVMVTGAAGSIGSELCRQLAGFGIKRLILYDNAETPMHNFRLELEDRFKDLDFVPVIGDVRSLPRLDFVFRNYHPQIVFHAAAYKHVPLMEDNPCEAVLVNVVGSRQVADKCIEYGVEKMVMISTDKAVNPTNVMGCTKRLAEIYVQSLGLAIEKGEKQGSTKFVTTRFGNVLGSNGSVIPRFRQQIAKGGPVTVTHPDINRFFMTIPEACRLVMEAATLSTGNQIFVFDMGEPVKIDTLARRMIKLAGLEVDKDIKIEYTGLRPGEKLYEEVLATSENTDPSFHERIRVARVRTYDYREALSAVDRLEVLSRAVEIPEMVKYMKQVVPEFISKNSRFEEYDKH